MKKIFSFVAVISFLLVFDSCKKECSSNNCVSNKYVIQPFIEKYGDFWCTGDAEYTYVFRRKVQIDSLTNCTFSPPMAFPVDETNMAYIMVGKTAYHYRDTFYTQLLKDSCNKKLIYEVKMTQQDTAYNTFSGVVSMFCSVENIPEDYEVEVKYKYVTLE